MKLFHPDYFERFMGLAGLALGALLLCAAALSSDRYGQSCAQRHAPDSPAWRQCVSRTSKGGPL
jgi:hypothetical protein